MKILFAHLVYRPGLEKWYASIANAAPSGVEVEPFCVTLSPPSKSLSWPKLNRMWHCRSPKLMRMYRRLRNAAQDCDVLLAYNGANIHPDFLGCLNTYNVFCCFDDPESSAKLSEPVAKHFDAVFYGNIASQFQYKHWGCEKLAWLPIFNAPMDVPDQAEREALFAVDRTVETAMICEHRSGFRHQRLEKLASAFPNATFYGDGWPQGRISQNKLFELYRNLKIGWNIHNSTGPINRRLFQLPAFGVMQICDNKCGLGQIYRLGEEAIGFDTIREAIELTHYYLEHNEERLRIAKKGYERFWKDYHAKVIWQRIVNQLKAWGANRKEQRPKNLPLLPGSDPKSIILPVLQKVKRNLVKHQTRFTKTKSVKNLLGTTRSESFYLSTPAKAYHENLELRGENAAEQRLLEHGFLDWPNILALNWAITALIGPANKIVELGSGTGPFAEFAAVDPSREIHCYEHDRFARDQAIALRSRENVHFYDALAPEEGKFDLLVCVEVLEHIQDLAPFFNLCRRLAPTAIMTTPNRHAIRPAGDLGPPAYPYHVREFDAGEVYMMLRSQYRNVSLYCLPNVYVPWIVPMTIRDKGTPIIAYCQDPYEAE
jgi:spore maturation protein CgeB